VKRTLLAAAFASLTLASSGCVIAHSRQAMSSNIEEVPPPKARFVQEEDSGLLLAGFIQIAEADHYAVLLARLRERHRCKRLSFPQLDYYTDHWLVVAFPIARVTAICEPEETGEKRP
jgi:hypothetical protein